MDLRIKRYGTGSGSDLAPRKPPITMAPGRYRSLYRTGAYPPGIFSYLQIKYLFDK